MGQGSGPKRSPDLARTMLQLLAMGALIAIQRVDHAAIPGRDDLGDDNRDRHVASFVAG